MQNTEIEGGVFSGESELGKNQVRITYGSDSLRFMREQSSEIVQGTMVKFKSLNKMQYA